MAVYYSKFIQRFADVTATLFDAKNSGRFPLSQEAIQAVSNVKTAVAKATLAVPVTGQHLTLETDASGTCVSGVLSAPSGHPIAFVSHRLSATEKNWSAIELEAYAVVVCTRKLRNFLVGFDFTIVTDQEGISFMFDTTKVQSRVKNAKLARWRIELSEFTYNIQYRPGPLNTVADALSRVASFSLDVPLSVDQRQKVIKTAHMNMGHPGVSRLAKFLKTMYRWEGLDSDVNVFVKSCKLCCEVKPRFHRPPKVPLVRAERPWERISIDFVGPKLSNTSAEYFLTIVDEYSRFPFAFPLKVATTQSAISCLEPLFTMFGPPLSLHSDRGTQFESKEFLEFLAKWNVVKSRTTPYNPAGNGQCERENGIIWATVQLRLRQKQLPLEAWPTELSMAVANIRALPSRAIGYETPHSRFLNFPRHSTLAPPKQTTKEPCNLDLVPEWLCPGAVVLFKRHVRNKSDPKTVRVEVVEVNSPHFITVKFSSGRVDTVATKHVARFPTDVTECRVDDDELTQSDDRDGQVDGQVMLDVDGGGPPPAADDTADVAQQVVRRTRRRGRRPVRYR